jgi:hypothetical protein
MLVIARYKAGPPRRAKRRAGPGQTCSEPTTDEHPTDQALTALRADWPAWEIWYVPLAVGGMTWCARRHDPHRRILNAHSPAELQEHLEAEALG